ncbi:DNA cytosine methyltransferase [Candidatus Foliamicus sp.]
MSDVVPVIDLFSGPGGLAEGFAAPNRKDGRRRYRIVLSIEKEAAAHRTLRLRAFLQKFELGLPEEYYAFLNGLMPEEPDWATLYPKQWKEACHETPRVELGTDLAASLVRNRVSAIRRKYAGRTVLLGGPPCQSYSVAGRARNAGNPSYNMDTDERLSLYKEYAKALAWLQPTVAVMENVKGILSARHNAKPVFEDVMDALKNAGGRGRYDLFALSPTTGIFSWADGLAPKDFLVRAEEHGVPQRRHRVFVICIRSDISNRLPHSILPKLKAAAAPVTVSDVVGPMPLLRSKLSRADDAESWQDAIRNAHTLVGRHLPAMSQSQEENFRRTLDLAMKSATSAPLPFRDEGKYGPTGCAESCPDNLRDWLCDKNLARLPNNETRGHIQEDLGRYLFAAAFASTFGKSPKSRDFPTDLAPKHANWTSGKFADRFRVQLSDAPATTITSHIAKDGHYFIHPDPGQCRSLTVREAARLQTFPDNYLFHGGRTQQYVQVGNAVPPYLALQIAEQVANLIEHVDLTTSRRTRQGRHVGNRSRAVTTRTPLVS